MRTGGAVALLAAVMIGGCAARDHQPLPSPPAASALSEQLMVARVVFEAADTDGDGFITEAEIARDMAAAFAAQDADRDGLLAPDELDAHAADAFARIDANGDGRLSFAEVMERKLADLKPADTDGDGRLSFGEFLALEHVEVAGQ